MPARSVNEAGSSISFRLVGVTGCGSNSSATKSKHPLIRSDNPEIDRQAPDHVSILPPIEFDIPSEQEDRQLGGAIDLDPLRPEVRDEWIEILERLTAGDVPDAVDLLAPAFANNRSTLLDYMPEDSIIVQVEPETIAIESEQLELREEEVYDGLLAAGEIPEGLPRPFAAPDQELRDAFQRFRVWLIGNADPDSHGRIVRTGNRSSNRRSMRATSTTWHPTSGTGSISTGG
ncbi:MAG: hypothetical protein R2849_13105 [Thermomicrobiales bacterium]